MMRFAFPTRRSSGILRVIYNTASQMTPVVAPKVPLTPTLSLSGVFLRELLTQGTSKPLTNAIQHARV